MKNRTIQQKIWTAALLLMLTVFFGFALLQNFPFNKKLLAASVLDTSFKSDISVVFPPNLSKVPRSHKVFGIKFAAPMNAATLNNGTLLLKDKNNTIVPGTVTYDPNTWTAYFKANNNLAVSVSPSNNPFTLALAADVKDIKNRLVGPFSASYTVNNVLDTRHMDSSSINWLSPAINNVGVDPLIGTIDIAFKKPLDPTTITDSSWSYTASPTSTFTSKTIYNPLTQAISIQLTSPLAVNTKYTIKINNTIKDVSGNNLRFGFEFNFFTGDILNSNAPYVKWTQFKTNSIDVNFDFAVPLLPGPAVNPANYNLNCAGSNIDLGGAWFFYDPEQRHVSIGDVAIPEKSSCALVLTSGITGLNGVPLDTESKTQTTATDGVQKTFKGDTHFSDFAKSTEGKWFKKEACADCKDLWDNPGVKFFNRIQVSASSNMAGDTAAYTFTFPITVPLANGDELQIIFPTGFDLAGANVTGNLNIYSDPAKVVKIASLTSDLTKGVITMPLQIGGDGKINGGLLTFTIKDVINPQHAGNEYVISYQTSFAGNGIKEGPNKFNPTVIKAAGNGEVVVTALDLNTVNPIPDVTVFFKSRDFGIREIITNADGDAVLENISINPAKGTDVQAWLDKTEIPTGYLTDSQILNFYLTSAEPSQIDTLFLMPATLQIKGVINHDGIGSDSATRVKLTASAPSGVITKTVLLNKTGSTNYTFDFSTEDDYLLTVEQYTDTKSGITETSFLPPVSQTANVTMAKSPLTINISLQKTVRKITGTITGSDGNPITNASITAVIEHSKKSNRFTSIGKTNTLGNYTLAVGPGNYKVEAYVAGFHGKIEKKVEIKNNDAIVNFVLQKPKHAISGNIMDSDENKIQDAFVQCFNTNGENTTVNTDTNGDYVMYINDGTWSCEARSITLGAIPAATGVTTKNKIVGGPVSGMNFVFEANNFATIKGVMKGENGGVIVGNWIGAEKIDKTTKSFITLVNSTKTDQNGKFSIIVSKNTPSEFYRLKTLTGQNAHFIVANNINASSDVDLGNIIYPKEKTLTINITGAPNEISTAVVNIHNLVTKSFDTVNVNLATGKGLIKIDLPNANYTASLKLPGSDEKKLDFTIASSDTAISFSYDNSVFSAITVKVKNSSGSPLENAHVEAFDQTTGRYTSASTDASGVAKLNLVTGNYTIKASSQNSLTTSIATSSGVTDYLLILPDANASISLNLKDNNNNPAAYVWVDAISTDSSNQWTGGKASGDGTITLNVPSGSSWNITARGASGNHGSKSAVLAGSSNVTVILNQIKSDFISKNPVALSINPTQDNVVTSDIANLTIEANALSNVSGSANLNIKKIGDVPTVGTTSALGGIGVEISSTDSSGKTIDTLNSDAVVDIKYDKNQILALVNTGTIKIDNFNAPLSSYDTVKGTWTVLNGAIIYVTVQEKSGDDYITTTIQDLIMNFDTGKNYRNYNDFTINYMATVNHFSIFAPVIFAPVNNGNSYIRKSQTMLRPSYSEPGKTTLKKLPPDCFSAEQNSYFSVLNRFIKLFTLQKP